MLYKTISLHLQSMPRSKVTMEYFPQIRDWISGFLDENKDMTASLIGHNLLGTISHCHSLIVFFGLNVNIWSICWKALAAKWYSLLAFSHL